MLGVLRAARPRPRVQKSLKSRLPISNHGLPARVFFLSRILVTCSTLTNLMDFSFGIEFYPGVKQPNSHFRPVFQKCRDMDTHFVFKNNIRALKSNLMTSSEYTSSDAKSNVRKCALFSYFQIQWTAQVKIQGTKNPQVHSHPS